MSLQAYQHFAKQPIAGAPLVFTFHGTGGDERQLVGLVEQALPKAGIVSPRGDVSEHGANRFFRRLGEGNYDMEDLAARTVKMIGFVRSHKESNPDARIYGLGYSNGANILASVVLDEPNLFDRVTLMHPLIPWRLKSNPALKSIDVLITAGRRAPICPLPLTEALAAFLQDQGAAVTLNLHEGGHEVSQQEVSAVAEFLRRSS
jgi:phospholipase/carboxylesterase